jgi:hypothetical protein
VSLAILVESERASERNVVELRRNSDDYKRQSSTESPSPLLSPSLKTETPNRTEGVLRPQLSARSSAAKAFDPKNKNENFVETNRRFKVDVGVSPHSQRSSSQSKDGEYYVLFLHSVQLLWTRLHPRRQTSRTRASASAAALKRACLVSPKEDAECETE